MNAWGIKVFRNFLLCFAIIAFITSCNNDLCNNSLRDEKISPNRKITASFFERNCGATTPYVQVVSLRFSDKKFNPEHFDDWVFTIHGRSKIKINWEETDKLSISYSGTGDIPTFKSRWGSVLLQLKLEHP